MGNRTYEVDVAKSVDIPLLRDNTELGAISAECRDFTRRGCDAQDKVQTATSSYWLEQSSAVS